MNDIKDLLISRISDINLLTNHQLKKTNHHPLKNQIKLSRINLHHINIEDFSESAENLEQYTRKLDGTYLVNQGNNDLDDSEIQKRQSRLNSLIRKKQKTRSLKQLTLLNALNLFSFINQKQIQEFYLHSIDIFQAFDTDFSKYKDPRNFLAISTSQNLKKIFSFFFLKNDQSEEFKYLIPEALSKEIWDLSPAFFLGWIRKWSISLLNSIINLNEDKNERKIQTKVNLKKLQEKIINGNLSFNGHKKQEKKSFNFISKSRSFKQSPNKPKKQSYQSKAQNSFRAIIDGLLSNVGSKDFCGQLSLNSKEIVYSYCLDDLKKYYRNYPIQDLDTGYLRTIKKMGKKEDILSAQNFGNVVQVLIEKQNGHIRESLNQFQQEYHKIKSVEKKHSSQISQKILPLFVQSPLISKMSSQINTQQTIKEISDKNTSNLLDMHPKLLNPSLDKGQPCKNKIKFTPQKYQEVSGVNQDDLLMNRQNSSEAISDHLNPKKIPLLSYNSVLTQQISKQATQIENKIRLLKKINKKNNGIKEKYLNGSKNITQQKQQKYFKESDIFTFLDDDIQPNQNITKLPKLKPIYQNQVFTEIDCPEDVDFIIGKNISVHNKRNKMELYLGQADLIKSQQIIQDHSYSLTQINKISQQLNDLIYRSNHEKKSNKIDHLSKNKRFLSENAEKESAENSLVDINEKRPQSNFSFKNKFFGGSKKSSFNVIRFAKNKTSFKGESIQCRDRESIHCKINGKLSIKVNHHKPTNLFSNQRNQSQIFTRDNYSFETQTDKDDFIKYLKNLQSSKSKSVKHKNSLQKYKQKSIKRKVM